MAGMSTREQECPGREPEATRPNPQGLTASINGAQNDNVARLRPCPRPTLSLGRACRGSEQGLHCRLRGQYLHCRLRGQYLHCLPRGQYLRFLPRGQYLHCLLRGQYLHFLPRG